MELEKYDFNKSSYYHKKSYRNQILIVISFFLVIALILFTTFNNSFSLTGKIIKGDEINLNNSFEISIESNVPELNLKGDYSEIILEGISGSDLYFDNKKILLQNTGNKLTISDFSGKININKNLIGVFDGKASEIILNGIPISDSFNKKIKIYFGEETGYEVFIINDDVYLEELSFIASGFVKFGEDRFSFNSDELIIKDYFGRIRIGDKMSLNGVCSFLNIKSFDKEIIIKN